MGLKANSIQNLFRNDKVVLVFLWLMVTSINLTKAFHIDDTFHLESGEWIMQHWTTPLSGEINWDNNAEPMHTFNQPVLFFYCVAVVGSVFSFGEIPMHVLLSIFSFIALLFFLKIQRLIYPKSSLLAVALFALCPAFIVNQNVMTDVPLLAFMLGFIFYLFKAADGSARNYIYSGIFLALCLLTKYTVLPLLLVYAIVFVSRQHFKHLWSLFIPIGALALWSLWNLAEFDGVHILGREASSFSFKSLGSGLLSFAGCLTAVLPLYFILSSYFNKKVSWVLTICLLLGVVFTPIAFVLGWISHEISVGILNIGLTLLGLFLIISTLCIVWKTAKQDKLAFSFVGKPSGVMLMCFVGMALFVILFAPFMASRHVLLTIPFLLLFHIPMLEKASSTIRNVILGATVFLGLVLGISDWHYAQYYKDFAQQIPASTPSSKVWSVGHWGWQWYANKQGASMYNRDAHDVSVGDRLVKPQNISAQALHPSLILQATDSLYAPSSVWNFFSVQNAASMYSSRYKKPAWTFSIEPIDTIVVYKVDSIDLLRVEN